MGITQKKRVEVIMANPYIEGMELLIKDGLCRAKQKSSRTLLRRLLIHYEIPVVSGIVLEN